MAGGAELKQRKNKFTYIDVFKNKTLMLLWTGKALSTVGDAFFDIAVMWVVYAQSGSVFQSALVGVIVNLSSVIMAPIAGAVADRWDRKSIMWSTNILQGLIVSIVAAIYFTYDYMPLVLALLSIFMLNSLSMFLSPAEASVMPEVIGKNNLSTAFGIFSTVSQAAKLIGKGVGGLAIAALGAGWALSGDALSFVVVAICIVFARIPKRKNKVDSFKKKLTFWKDINEGWIYIKQFPVIKALIWLAFLVNIISFLGPITPALVDTQLHSGVKVFATLEIAMVLGGSLGGVTIGFFEKHFKTGHLLGGSLLVGGVCTLGIGISSYVNLTIILMFIQMATITIANVMLTSIQLNIVSDNYRGRVFGIMRSFAMLAMPISTLLAGTLGDIIGVSILYVFAGIWVVGISIFAFYNPQLRNIDKEIQPTE